MKSFQTHVKAIAHVSQQVAEAEMEKVVKEIRAASNAANNETTDVTVCCDGTWARRGFQLLYGVVAGIHVDTGKVVDYEVKSKVASIVGPRKILIPLLSSTLNGWKPTCPSVLQISTNHPKPWSLEVQWIYGAGL